MQACARRKKHGEGNTGKKIITQDLTTNLPEEQLLYYYLL